MPLGGIGAHETECADRRQLASHITGNGSQGSPPPQRGGARSNQNPATCPLPRRSRIKVEGGAFRSGIARWPTYVQAIHNIRLGISFGRVYQCHQERRRECGA